MSGTGVQTSDWFAQNAPSTPTGSTGAPKASSTAVSSPQAAPAAASASGGDWFSQNAPANAPATPEQPGILARAWKWATQTPVLDNVLPKGITTKDIMRGVAFEQLFNEPYIPGVNDFDTKAAMHLGDSPTKDAVKTFIAGSAKDTADLGTSMTTPVGIATLALGPASKVPGAIGTAAKVALPLVSAAYAGKGVSDIAAAGTETTPEAWQQRLTGGAELAGGAAGVGESVKSALSNPLAETMTTPRGATPPENFTPGELKAYADANGIPLTAAQVTENVGARAVQSSGERAVFGGSDVKAAIKGSQDAIAAHAEDMANSFSPQTPDLASRGAAIQKSVQTALDTQLSKADANYANVDEAAQGTTVNLKPVKEAADQILSDSAILQKAGLDPKTATRVLKGIDSLDDDASFTDAQKLRSALLDLSRSPELAISTTAQGMLKQVIGATDSAMMDAAQETPELQKAFRGANAHYEQIQEDLNSPRSPLNQILSEPDPSKVPQKLTAKGQTGGSPYNAGLLDTYGIDKGPIKATITQDLLNRNFGMYGKSLGGYSDAFLKSVFTPEELDDLYKTGMIARSVGLNTNPSGTAAVSSAIGQTRHPILEGIPQAIAAKLTTNPHFNDWLTERGVAPPVRNGAATAAVAAAQSNQSE
jgi:hypothetical protein